MPSSKLSNCKNCPLHKKQTLVVGETNCEDDLGKVDLLILGEAPASEEAKAKRPLVGTAGKIFREAFKKSGLIKTKHYISNVVLCTNITDKTTDNPPILAIQQCKPNWEELIRITNPKVILIMGSISMNVFGLGDKGITKKRENNPYTFGEENTPLYITLHPSYINRNGGIGSELWYNYLSDFEQIYFEFWGKKVEKNRETGISLKEPYKFKFPKWTLSKNYKLMDVQHNVITGEIIHIFQDINGVKEYYKTPDSNYYYYTVSENLEDADVLAKISEVELIEGHPEGWSDQAKYESDLRTELKHSIDYYINRTEPEPDVKLKIMYFDIEVYMSGSKSFPDPRKNPDFPINAISYKCGEGPSKVIILALANIDVAYMKIKDDNVSIVGSESQLLKDFCRTIKQYDPNLLAGWNSNGFDIPYIYNRLKANKIDPNKLSPVGSVSINPKRYNDIFIEGIYSLDMLELYKDLTPNREESYTLDFIATKTLGEGKVKYSGSLENLYEKDIKKFIEYSYTDTQLLYEINIAKGHIDLREEIRKICGSTWKASETTTGQLDPLCISYAKQRGFVCKNAEGHKSSESLPGAYVRDPIPGLHNYLVDFDYKSLYPSIICSMNIGPNTYAAKIDPIIAFDYIYRKERVPKSFKMHVDPMKLSKCKTYNVNIKVLDQFIKQIDGIVTVAGTIFKGHSKEISFFNEILTYLIGSRNVYKNKRNESKKSDNKQDYKMYDNKQWAFKILANALYGVLGTFSFRFFKLDLAKSITLTGQEAIKFAGFHTGNFMKKKSKDIVPSFMDNYDEKNIPYLVYTDTDSIFVRIGDYLLEEGKLKQ